jgi:mono/diheme cytochrome c family protein
MRCISLTSLVGVILLAGCQQQMAEQPAYRPLEASAFFPDERSARPRVPGTVPRGFFESAVLMDTGRTNNAPAKADAVGGIEDYVKILPVPLSSELLKRGQERFEIFCAVCHGNDGTGNGKIVERGYTRPPNYVTDRSRGFERKGVRILLREVPIGYFFEVISKGYGAMPDYESQIPPADRWSIAAYVRALQFSQHLRLSDLPENERDEIRNRLGNLEAQGPGGAP